MTTEQATPHRMVVLALDRAIGYDMCIPSQIFRTASDADGNRLYDVRMCSAEGEPVRTDAGFLAEFEHGPEAIAEADTLVIPGTRIEGPRTDRTLPSAVTEALARLPAHARIMSICTGAFVLAAAGILDGRPATTHWAHSELFRRLYPKVLLNEQVLFVDDGDVLTSAGLCAGLDLCLHVLRADHGSEVANRVARYCVVPPWREGGQRQFVDLPLPDNGDASTAATREWALHRLESAMDLDTLAAHAKMSVRTFSRRFRAETGASPGRWLLRQRLARARHLLETTDLPVDRVAAESGLGTAASLRQHMRAELGVSPLAYRKTFRVPSHIL